ncbi:CLUMA_CG018351, isoform A [Clunio marinus]|uniref:CLUMA_CG018351, isoform A n=1 Tax=Clunio marinus TaxID=568069 RepID=A0A1J1IZ29_9DIPT|nr:CLUMA_CG018351, isoform A [Clunio marinus]
MAIVQGQIPSLRCDNECKQKIKFNLSVKETDLRLNNISLHFSFKRLEPPGEKELAGITMLVLINEGGRKIPENLSSMTSSQTDAIAMVGKTPQTNIHVI